MKARCKNNLDYVKKKITVCKRWHKFENFYADMGDPPPGTSLDRRDNKLGYSPANCRWSTKIVQNNNTSRNIVQGRSIRQEALALGLSPQTMYSRIRSGLSPDDALQDVDLRAQRAATTKGLHTTNSKKTQTCARIPRGSRKQLNRRANPR
jgi:hypothetical protein